MSILLLFPPCSTSVSSPPASLATLQAFLKQRGIQVAVKDLNIEFILHVINCWESFYSNLCKKLEGRLEGSCPPNSRRYYGKILYGFAPAVKSIADAIKQMEYCNVESFVNILFETVNCIYFSDRLNNNSYMFLGPEEMDFYTDIISADSFFSNFFLARVCGEDIKLVGISLLSESQLPFGLAIAKILKKISPDVRIVAGGPYVTEVAEEEKCSKYFLQFFDYLCLHEGETALAEIFDSLAGSVSISHPNIITKDKSYDGRFHIEPIDSLPSLDFEGLPLVLYLTSDMSLPFYTSKGCTWGRCKFCSLVANRYREKKMGCVIRDIKLIIEKTGIRHYQFVDENISPERLRNLSHALISEDFGIRWFVQIRFDNDLDLETLDIMKQSGCYAIEFGLESGSSEILKDIRKGIALPVVERVLFDCARLGIEVILNCMVGFPGETLEHAWETVDFLDKLVRKNPLLKVSCNTQIVKIYKSSPYIRENYLTYSSNLFSTIVEWENPDWVSDFMGQCKDHYLFSAKPRTPDCVDSPCGTSLKKPGEYSLELSKSCIYLGEVFYDFQENLIPDTPMKYMMLLYPSKKPEIYLLNEPMDFIVRSLAGGKMNLVELKNSFIQFFNSFESEEQLRSLSSGLIYLTEIEGISIW